MGKGRPSGRPLIFNLMFESVKNKTNKFKKLTLKKVFHELFKDKDFTNYIIDLNTGEQLYDKGIDSTGKRLDAGRNGYAAFTITEKERKGQPIDRITLKDTGEFYNSFKCKWDSSGSGSIKITADTMKESGDLLTQWGKDILGLDEESLSKLRGVAKEKIKSIIMRLTK